MKIRSARNDEVDTIAALIKELARYEKALLIHLAKLCVQRGYHRFQWWVLNWNAPSIDFYKGLGAVAMDEWTTMRVEADALRALAALT